MQTSTRLVERSLSTVDGQPMANFEDNLSSGNGMSCTFGYWDLPFTRHEY